MSKMAAANLFIDDNLKSAWSNFSEYSGTSTPVLSLSVSSERVTLAESTEVAAGEGLWSYLTSQATLALSPPAVASGSKPSILPPRPEPRLWLTRVGSGRPIFVSFTPEGVHPRNKMLYASARDDLRRGLSGASSLLGADYHASEVGELSEGAFSEWARRDAAEAMSSRERQAAEVSKAITHELATMPVRAVGGMQKVPFTLHPDLLASAAMLRSQHNGEDSSPAAPPACRWMEVRVGDNQAGTDTLECGSSGSEAAVKPLSELFFACSPNEPRFFLTAPDTSLTPSGLYPLLLIYHCPELAKPKLRMKYSTAKGALLESLSGAGISVGKVVRLV